MMMEQETQGGLATPRWHRETDTGRSDDEVPVSATASTHEGRGGGGWGSDGGTDVSAAEAVSADVPMQRDTVHIGLAQSALGHALPQMPLAESGCRPAAI